MSQFEMVKPVVLVQLADSLGTPPAIETQRCEALLAHRIGTRARELGSPGFVPLGLRLRPLQAAIDCILPASGWFLRPARPRTFARASK